MATSSEGLSWVDRARRVREGEHHLAHAEVDVPHVALRDLVATMLRRSFDAVVLCTGTTGEYLEVSDSFCGLTGYDRAELLGRTSVSLGLVAPDGGRARAERDAGVALDGIYENTIVRKDGARRVVEFSHQFLDTEELVLVIARDVTERRNRERELARLAREDPLTGVLNRRGFNDAAAAMLERARTDGSSVHVVVMDLDELKSVNDQLGHEFGDQALVAVASAVTEIYGPTAAVGRLGGDEFAVAVGDRTEDEVAKAQSALSAALARTAIGPAGAQRPVTVSAGTATAAGGIGTVDRLIAAADAVQYLAKRARQAPRISGS
ncbi:MAG TPA: sensor domain-containing diguanylate cyclase [Nocardioides sp.]|nr:sensor domain-containing diguanylate cyclase [Nocardioides sp.]